MHTSSRGSCRFRLLPALSATCFAAAAILPAGPALAQITNAAGVRVDPQGVLRAQAVADAGLSTEKRKAAIEALPGDLQKKVPLRKVALSRLEAALAAHAADGRGIPEEIG
jgi:hypothetical protein